MKLELLLLYIEIFLLHQTQVGRSSDKREQLRRQDKRLILVCFLKVLFAVGQSEVPLQAVFTLKASISSSSHKTTPHHHI